MMKLLMLHLVETICFFLMYVSDDRLCLLNVQQALYTHCHINLHTKINTYAPLFRFVIGKISHQHAMQGRESSEEPIITSKHYMHLQLNRGY